MMEEFLNEWNNTSLFIKILLITSMTWNIKYTIDFIKSKLNG